MAISVTVSMFGILRAVGSIDKATVKARAHQFWVQSLSQVTLRSCGGGLSARQIAAMGRHKRREASATVRDCRHEIGQAIGR